VPPPAPTPADRELAAVRELLHAMLRADHPEEVFQHALDRVTPLAGASFASVYLVDGASELMRLVAACNWPDAMRPWLGTARVRVGFGPSGEAASERRAIEIPDVFADPELEDWHEVARELGFRAIVALPLQSGNRVLGTVAFYFLDSGSMAPSVRQFLRTVAELLAAAADKTQLLDDLRRAQAAVNETSAELALADVAVLDERRASEALVLAIADAVAESHAANTGVGVTVEALVDLAAAHRGTLTAAVEEFDPRVPLRDAMKQATGLPEGVGLMTEEPVLAQPPMRSDREKIARTLVTFLEAAYRSPGVTEVRAAVQVASDWAVYRVSGGDTAPSAFGLAVARSTARALGGRILSDTHGGFRLELPMQCPVGGTPSVPDGV
jgi:GAF domain